MSIPKRLAQTWKSNEIPDDLAAMQAGWRRHNPDFDFQFYDDAAGRDLVKSVIPQYLDQYDAMPFGVMRADVFRYAVLLRDGGLYADMDMECLAAFPDQLLQCKCLLSQEAHLDPRRQRQLGYRKPVQFANCIMGCEPGHPFFELLLQESFRLFGKNPRVPLEMVEDITGPRMLTRTLYASSFTDISIASQIVLMAPLNHPNMWPFNINVVSRHRTMGSWKQATRGKTLNQKWIERNRIPALFPKALASPFVPLSGDVED